MESVFAQGHHHGVDLAHEVGTPGARVVVARFVESERPEFEGFFDWLNGKWGDGFAAWGPWITTTDEVSPDPNKLEMTLKVNDKIVTTSGIFGQVTRLGGESVQLQIADKVRIEVSRAAIGGYQGQPAVVEPPNPMGA